MIIINKGATGDTFTTTLYEKLSFYDITGATTGSTYFFKFVSDISLEERIIPLIDISPNIWRYNQFEINETDYNFVTGQYSYSASTNSGFTNTLEVGRMVVNGINNNNPVYW